jgi:hypothetical protein
MSNISKLQKETSVLEKRINNILKQCFNKMSESSAEEFVSIAKKHNCHKQILEHAYRSQFDKTQYDYIKIIAQKLANYEKTHNLNKEIFLKCFAYIILDTKSTDYVIKSEKQEFESE